MSSGLPLSQARWVGKQLHTSGIVGINPGQEQIPGLLAQIATIFERAEAVLTTRGLSVGDIVSVTVYLASMSDFALFNEEYARFVRAPYPVRTTVECGLFPGALVEMSMIAHAADQPDEGVPHDQQ